MKTVKFGGSSLATSSSIRTVAEIVREDQKRRLVVVSAPGKRSPDDTKVTDLLIAAAEARLTNKSGREEMDRVVARFEEIAGGLGLPSSSIQSITGDLEARLQSDTGDEGLFTDTLKAAGEANCARLMAEYLCSRGTEAHFVDPLEGGMMLSDEPGNARVPAAIVRQTQKPARPPRHHSFSRVLRLLRKRPAGNLSRAVAPTSRGRSSPRRSTRKLYENFTDVDSVFAASPPTCRQASRRAGNHLPGDARVVVRRFFGVSRRGPSSRFSMREFRWR